MWVKCSVAKQSPRAFEVESQDGVLGSITGSLRGCFGFLSGKHLLHSSTQP